MNHQDAEELLQKQTLDEQELMAFIKNEDCYYFKIIY